MSFWNRVASVAVALGLTVSAHSAQAFSVPVPGVQQEVGRTGLKLVPADKMLRLKSSPGAGRSESDALKTGALKAGALKAGALSEAERSARGKLRATQCLATAMYFEARGEPSRGQFIVGRVILNRVASRFYPNDICAVVYQNANLKNRCQFSFACDGAPNLVRDIEAWREIRRRATYLVECDDKCSLAALGRSDLWTSTHYHADYVNPNWAKKLQRTGQVGRHIFYYTSTM